MWPLVAELWTTFSCRGGMLSRIFHSFFKKLQIAIFTTFRMKIDGKKWLKSKISLQKFLKYQKICTRSTDQVDIDTGLTRPGVWQVYTYSNVNVKLHDGL